MNVLNASVQGSQSILSLSGKEKLNGFGIKLNGKQQEKSVDLSFKNRTKFIL